MRNIFSTYFKKLIHRHFLKQFHLIVVFTSPSRKFVGLEGDRITLLAEAFPLCFSALYCHSLRGFGCSRFFLVVSVPRREWQYNAEKHNGKASASRVGQNINDLCRTV